MLPSSLRDFIPLTKYWTQLHLILIAHTFYGIDKMDWDTKPDRITYLRELLEHCDIHIRNQFFPPELLDIIKEQKHKCEHELRILKQADIEAMYMGNVLA